MKSARPRHHAVCCIVMIGNLIAAVEAASGPDRQLRTDVWINQFERDFAVTVVDEECRQTVFRTPEGLRLKSGPYAFPPSQRTVRTTHSELLLVWREKDGWLMRRRTRSPNNSTSSGESFEAIASRGINAVIQTASALPESTPVFNSASAMPFLDYPIWPIALLDANSRVAAGVQTGVVQWVSSELRFDAHRDGSDGKMSLFFDSEGRLKRSVADFTSSTASFNLDEEWANSGTQHIVFPKKVVERYRHGLEVVSSEASYSNVRRFRTSGEPIR